MKNGPWVTKGGYEYALVLAVVFAAIGLAGVLPISVDAVFGLAGDTTALYAGTFILAAVAVGFATLLGRPREEHRTAPR